MYNIKPRIVKLAHTIKKQADFLTYKELEDRGNLYGKCVDRFEDERGNEAFHRKLKCRLGQLKETGCRLSKECPYFNNKNKYDIEKVADADILDFNKRRSTPPVQQPQESIQSRKVDPKIAEELYQLVGKHYKTLKEVLPKIVSRLPKFQKFMKDFPKANEISKNVDGVLFDVENRFGLTDERYAVVDDWLNTFYQIANSYVDSFMGVRGIFNKGTQEDEENVRRLVDFINDWVDFRNKNVSDVLAPL